MNNLKSATSAYSWVVVAMLWIVAFLNYLDRILITSMRDPIVADFSLTDAQFGLLTSVFLWCYGFLSPFGGFLADKYSRKKMIVFSVAIWSAVTLWTGFATSFYEMLIARTMMGISEACYIPAALALITEYHGKRTRSFATGLHMRGLYAGVMMSGIGGYIAELWGWRYGFQAFGLFGILYSIVLLFLLKDKKPEKLECTSNDIANSQEGISILGCIKALFSVRSFIIVLIYFCAFGMVSWVVWGWLPTLLKDHFHLGLGEAGISATLYIQIGSFAGVILGGLIADRWSRSNIRSRLYVVVIGFSIGAPFLFLMSSTPIFSIAILGMIFYGLARGFTDANIMPIICQIIDERYIATGYGFLNFLSAIVGGGMVYVGGALKDAQIDLSVTYQVIAVIMLLATWLLLTVKIKKENYRI
jgi:MFS transporter, Spinster family, sphingosine-1-phosphate transporter